MRISFGIMALLSLFLTQPLAPAAEERAIFVACDKVSLKNTFDDTFEPDGEGLNVPISGEEIALKGYRQLGNSIFEEQQGLAPWRERRKILDRQVGSTGKYTVYCHKGTVKVVQYLWTGDLTELYKAMDEKYSWNISKFRFISDVKKFQTKGIVYLVRDEKDRLITVTIAPWNSSPRVRVNYYQSELVSEEIEALLAEDEKRAQKKIDRNRKAREDLL